MVNEGGESSEHIVISRRNASNKLFKSPECPSSAISKIPNCFYGTKKDIHREPVEKKRRDWTEGINRQQSLVTQTITPLTNFLTTLHTIQNSKIR